MTEQNFEHMRRAMVASQLRTSGVNHPAVLAAMGAVPRERFVPEDKVSAAYADAIVSVGDGRELNSPMSLGRMLDEVDPREGERALLVGAATGYAAAVLARIVGEVVAVEEDAALAARARQALKGTGVKLVEGPSAKGWKKGAPYDLILIDGAVEYVPDALIDQLADGGRLVTGMVDDRVQRLALGRRAGTAFGIAPFADVGTAVLPGFVRPREFVF